METGGFSMKKRRLASGFVLLAAFALWTVLVCAIDVQAIGPMGSSVGFAEMNRFVHDLTGVHMALYTLTDWLGLVPAAIAIGFGMLGLCQWIQRKHILKVDFSILVLGGFYLAVLAAYLFFEEFPVNYRPVLIDGRLEASYPSSTTLLTLCVMPAAWLQLKNRIQNPTLKKALGWIIAVFTAFMVISRLLSGVHWLTDIIGAMLLSGGLVALYSGLIGQ